MPSADDERLGQLFKLLRRESGLTQEEIAVATSIPDRDLQKLEDGRAADILYGRIGRLFSEVEGRSRISVWWKGAAADRLLDEKHASLGERGSRYLVRCGWLVPSEFTYSIYGERGSIDLFGHRREVKAVAVCEIKSAFGSLEELNRSLDAKVRLAPKLCRERFGWTPVHVGRLLIVPDESTIRRAVATYRQTMDSLYPERGRTVRAWIRQPDRSIGGIWFLSYPRNTQTVSGREA